MGLSGPLIFKRAMLSHVLGILQQETTLQIETRRQCGPAGRRREDSTQENMMMNAAGEELLHRCVYTQRLLRTEAFTHTGAFTQRSLYTERLLDTEAFAHRGFYTEKSSYRLAFTRRSFYTERRLYTEELLRTEAFTQRSLYTKEILHTNAFTQRSFYTEKREFLHTDAFAHRSVFTEKPLHRSFYTQVLHREIFTQRDLPCAARRAFGGNPCRRPTPELPPTHPGTSPTD